MHIAWLVLVIGFLRNSKGQDDSLRSAVEALGQRQRELDYEDNPEYGYTLERPEDLIFLNPTGYGRERNYERPGNLNYLDDDSKYDPEVGKRISSSFRERVEEDNQRQLLEEMADNLVNNMESRGSYNVENEDYDEILKELWDKYRRPSKVYATTVNKRWMAPRFGLDGAGLRKRNPYGTSGGEYYDDTYGSSRDNYDENDDDDDYNNLRKRYAQNRFSKVRQMYSNPYSGGKRFPVTKRSSDLKELSHEHKRSSIKKQTDPKVEKDLSNIFGDDKIEETTTKKPESNKPPKMENNKKDIIIAKSPKDTKTDKKIAAVNKEQFTTVSATESEKSLQIKKKSIDWSDYFGLDRRKKSSDPNDLDKEWLIERYHKSVKMSNKKRSADMPLSSFRDRDEKKKSSGIESDKTLNEEQKINDMDAKLQVMEDKIVDDAIKFTGANEGETDPKEVQEVKDKIISRLAAAYSLEKMRIALGEYRLAMAKERERLKNRHPTTDDDYLFSEEKRTDGARKHEDREENPEADNNIRCRQGDDECREQKYKFPHDTQNHYGRDVCPAISRVCNEGAVIAGEFRQVFKTACHYHEMCMLCSNNSWFPPTRHCHSLFLAKSFDLCKGDAECQKLIQRSVQYLPEITRSLHAEDPSSINECEMSCPESDAVMEPISR